MVLAITQRCLATRGTPVKLPVMDDDVFCDGELAAGAAVAGIILIRKKRRRTMRQRTVVLALLQDELNEPDGDEAGGIL